MLLGTYEPNLIGKNRLALPTKLRKEISGSRVVLAIGFDECILGFEERKWEQVTASDLARPLSDSEGRELSFRPDVSNKWKQTSHPRFLVPLKSHKYL